MDVFVVDDSEQRTPSRAGMGPLVSAGGIYVPSESIRSLERGLAALCQETGFPEGEEFKWSPGRERWMYRDLRFADRERFFLQTLRLAQDARVVAIVCVEDTERQPARFTAQSHEEDVVTLLLERAYNLLRSRGREALVLVDRPKGDRAAEVRYLARHLQTIIHTREVAGSIPAATIKKRAARRRFRAIITSVRELGLEVRAGLHTGECELMYGKVGGIAVHIGRGLQSRRSRELVSSTTT